MDRILHKISNQARDLFDIDTYGEHTEEYYKPFINDFVRPVSIMSFISLMEETMRLFENNKISSDGWFAPRLHAALRLYRMEAADLSVWEYLSLTVPEAQKDIKWRWGDDKLKSEDLKEFSGPCEGMLWRDCGGRQNCLEMVMITPQPWMHLNFKI